MFTINNLDFKIPLRDFPGSLVEVCAPNAGGMGLIPGQRTKIPCVVQCSKKKKKKKKKLKGTFQCGIPKSFFILYRRLLLQHVQKYQPSLLLLKPINLYILDSLMTSSP